MVSTNESLLPVEGERRGLVHVDTGPGGGRLTSRPSNGEHAAATAGLPSGESSAGGARGARGPGRHPSPWSPFPLALVQEGGGEAWGRTTGAKALFCFTAEMTLAGENEKMLCVPLQFEGRVTEEAAMVGLDGTTATKHRRSGRAARGAATRHRELLGPRLGRRGDKTSMTRCRLGRSLDNRQTLVLASRFQSGSPILCRFPTWPHGGGPPQVNLPSPHGHPASRATLPLTQQLTSQNSQAMHTFDLVVNTNLRDDV